VRTSVNEFHFLYAEVFYWWNLSKIYTIKTNELVECFLAKARIICKVIANV